MSASRKRAVVNASQNLVLSSDSENDGDVIETSEVNTLLGNRARKAPELLARKKGTASPNQLKVMAVLFGIVSLGALLASLVWRKGGVTATVSSTDLKGLAASSKVKYAKLPNGAVIVAWSDLKLDKAAAAISVGTGHWSDPSEHLGLAHYVEHLVFLGSKGYPKEDVLFDLMSRNGGHSNAYTGAHETVFFFEASPHALQEGVSVLTDSLARPLLHKEASERELSAVDAEHNKNKGQDMWRLDMLGRSFAKQSHPMSKFGTGDSRTLTGAVEAARDFHARHYVGSNVAVVVVGPQPVEQLVSIGIDSASTFRSSFTPPTKNPGPSFMFAEPATNASQAHMSLAPPSLPLWCVTAAKEMSPLLTISVPVPIHEPTNLPSKLPHFISHLLGYEGEGSLAEVLKTGGLVNSLNAAVDDGNKYEWIVEIQMKLPQETQDDKVKINRVLQALWNWVAKLQRSSSDTVSGWWQDSSTIAELHAKFPNAVDASNTAVSMASRLTRFAPVDAIRAAWHWEEFDYRKFLQIMNAISPERSLYIMAENGPSARPLAPVGSSDESTDIISVPGKEKWYSMDYSIANVPKRGIAAWTSNVETLGWHGLSALKLPSRNKFIPKNLSLLFGSTPSKEPVEIASGPHFQVFGAEDSSFGAPKSYFSSSLLCPVPTAFSPHTQASMDVLTNILSRKVTKRLYDSSIAGDSVIFAPSINGFQLTASGWSDTLPQLVNATVIELLSLFGSMTPEDANFAKKSIEQSLVEELHQPAFQAAIKGMRQTLRKYSWSAQELLAALPSVRKDTLLQTLESCLNSRPSIRSMLVGNSALNEATEITLNALSTLTSTNTALLEQDPSVGTRLLFGNEIQQATGVLPRDQWLITATPNNNPEDKNHALVHYMQYGEVDDDSSARILVLSSMLQQKCFEDLRTKQQLGYIVGCRGSVQGGMGAFIVYVQSIKHNTMEIEQRILDFLGRSAQYVSEMGASEFNQFKDSTVEQLTFTDKSIASKASRWDAEIEAHTFRFDRTEKLKESVASVTLDDVKSVYSTLISPGCPRVSSWIVPQHINLPSKKDVLDVGQGYKGMFAGSPGDAKEYITKYHAPK